MDNSNLNSALHLLLTEVYGVREIKSVEIKSYEIGSDRKNLITFKDEVGRRFTMPIEIERSED